ncbi:hypothetical protein OOZ19_18870 [Saccharopolyspora sp. NFXS83]|uniref:hypothetical protein n=1 Tax=Saccharopolyspora sp. NFXS83 TaxID=2993560 RepID=UPI00224B5A3F|nr:hypothetical protein [Saccharopolyspora sp. NFXS83]MCX2732306.1 hypothetical protein [Saccharopolyspora sp. NFXS83]
MATETPKRTAGAFDIRLIIAVLFFLYGLVLTVLGATASAEDVAKAAGMNINLWSGLGMLVFAVGFALWVRLRPLIVPDGSTEESAAEH